MFCYFCYIYFQIRNDSKPYEVISLLCFRETCLIICVECQPILLVTYMISQLLKRKCELVIFGI